MTMIVTSGPAERKPMAKASNVAVSIFVVSWVWLKSGLPVGVVPLKSIELMRKASLPIFVIFRTSVYWKLAVRVPSMGVDVEFNGDPAGLLKA